MSDKNSTENQKQLKKHAILIWLGLRDNSFTRQKTVKFGDSTAINSGRFYSIVTVVSLLSLWTISSVFQWIEPFFWPQIDAVLSRFSKLASEGFRNIALFDHVSISVYRVLSGVFYGSLVGIPLGLAMGLSSVIRGLVRPRDRIYAPHTAFGTDSIGNSMVWH